MHPSFLHLGHLRLPIYGICAAFGLMSVLVLSQITARLARLDPDRVWDAVISIALAALVISRALLIVGSFRFFLQQPLLVLLLPTVNDTGLLLTAVFAAAYLRWKRLPPLGFLDAVAPCLTLLWAFLSLGWLLDGTRDGMPTRWFAAWNGVWPVEALTLLASIFLCAKVLRRLRLGTPSGRVCAFGLAEAGAAIFALDFLRLPTDLDGTGILDPVQWLGLAMIVAGAAVVIAVPDTQKSGRADAV